jgi:hypothetical protein
MKFVCLHCFFCLQSNTARTIPIITATPNNAPRTFTIIPSTFVSLLKKPTVDHFKSLKESKHCKHWSIQCMVSKKNCTMSWCIKLFYTLPMSPIYDVEAIFRPKIKSTTDSSFGNEMFWLLGDSKSIE